MKYLWVFLILLLGCDEASPQSKAATSNPDFKLELLFEAEGCKFYRYSDGYRVHVTMCENSISTGDPQSCGKNCLTEDIVVIGKRLPKPNK